MIRRETTNKLFVSELNMSLVANHAGMRKLLVKFVQLNIRDCQAIVNTYTRRRGIPPHQVEWLRDLIWWISPRNQSTFSLENIMRNPEPLRQWFMAQFNTLRGGHHAKSRRHLRTSHPSHGEHES